MDDEKYFDKEHEITSKIEDILKEVTSEDEVKMLRKLIVGKLFNTDYSKYKLEELLNTLRNDVKEHIEYLNMNVITKMSHDEWHNLVVLKNGDYFVASHINNSYEKYGQTWIEFSFTNTCNDFKFKKFKLNGINIFSMDYSLRDLAVNASEIAYIIEEDS